MIQDFDNFTRKNKKFSNEDFFKDQQSTTSSMTFRILQGIFTNESKEHWVKITQKIISTYEP